MKQHYYAFDVGIGSVGWAVLEVGDDNARILDFGTRVFSSGEDTGSSDTENQIRRGYRTKRRVIRRRKHRRERLKEYLINLGIVTENEIRDYYAKNDLNIYKVRAKGLDEKLSPAELSASLIHISNHRGYKEFYEDKDNKKEAKDTEKIKMAIDRTKSLLADKKYRTIGEMIAKDDGFKNYSSKDGSLPLCRNHHGEYKYMFLRSDNEYETRMILDKQKEYYPALNDESIKKIIEIIFSQRLFEYGPGDKDDETRRYKGFLASEAAGRCSIYKDEPRGARHTVIGDIFAVINALQQYHYLNTDTGEEADFGKIVNLVVDYVLKECEINKTKLHSLLKKNGIELISSDAQDIGKCIKYLKPIRAAIEDAGLDWDGFISEPQFDLSSPSRLHILGCTLAKYITPSLRREKLKEINEKLKETGFVNDRFIDNTIREKYSGTANVSFKYMLEAISEARKGVKPGVYQSERNVAASAVEKSKYLGPIKDADITLNPVVFRSINETRKIINALISKYGRQPSVINIEVARDLGSGEKATDKISANQRRNAKKREEAAKKIKELFGIGKPKQSQIERYLLYEEQGGKSLYSCADIDINRLLSNEYEVDHIIPFSLILDDSLNNKALVTTKENREKGQRAPLEYLKGAERSEFIKRIKAARKSKKINDRKFEYALIETLQNEEKLKEWKTRNINDTRYITKYIAGYLQGSLVFESSKKRNVHQINGAVTARFRQKWLKGTDWGKEEKERGETQLHHAIDAIVLANLTPEYIELASDYLKLRNILRVHGIKKDHRGTELPAEYFEYLGRCCEKMKKYYGYNEDYTQRLLEGGKIPSIVTDLKNEVSLRLDSKNEEEFRRKAAAYYKDEAFAKTLRLPLVSRKQERKFRGAVACSDNPVSYRESNGQGYIYTAVSLDKINTTHVDKLTGLSRETTAKLKSVFEGRDKKYTLGDYMKEHPVDFLKRKDGKLPKRLTIAEPEGKEIYRKTISEVHNSGEPNTQYWDTRKYYCLEVYKDHKDKTRVRGLRYIDFRRKDGRLYLAVDYPADYKSHVHYLYKNDYIIIKDNKGVIKHQGFYQSPHSIPSPTIWLIKDNEVKSTDVFLAQSCSIEKRDVSILGEKGGSIKCGEPYSLLRESR